MSTETSNVVDIKPRNIPITIFAVENSFIPFDNVYELTKFLQGEIRSSKMKYSFIAKKAGCVPQTVSRIACGETKDPRTGTVIKILFALGRTIYVR